MSRCRILQTGCVVGAAYFCLATACTPTQYESHRQSTRQTDPGAEHALQSERLEEIMGDLGADFLRIWPQEVQAERQADARRERERKFIEVESAARDLHQTSKRLPSLVADAELTPEDRQSFTQLSQKMAEQSIDLGRAAQDRDLDAVKATMSSLTATCNECHTRFRAHAGPLP